MFSSSQSYLEQTYHHQLVVADSSIDFMESDFSAGGFVFKSTQDEKEWEVNLELISFCRGAGRKSLNSEVPNF